MKSMVMVAGAVLWHWSALAGNFVTDVYTQSNYNDVKVTNMSMNLMLDMDNKFFDGYVDLFIDNPHGHKVLNLDTKALVIEAVSIADGENSEFKEASFEVGENHQVLGRALKIAIRPSTKMVRVNYATTKESTGIDWKDPSQTGDGFPMVTTQFQAINARTFVPCQDTPAQKITYSAKIALKSTVKDPRMKVVMAADIRNNNGDGSFSFKMSNKIPTYLIALAAGVFDEIPISDRVKVIAEPSMVKKAAAEFADAEKMVQAAEAILGPYAWGRFDIFIMPPSFPYGGMENPTMTFIGPTVVAGDKSLVDVIAHELAHSWSGNFVTNTTWNDFWINEGTTMYVQRLITAALYGPKLTDLDIVLGQQVLKDDIDVVSKKDGHALTRLHLDLNRDFDPDDAVTYIPYEKGFNFWLALEQAYGQKAVVDFLKKMFSDHAFGNMDTKKLHDMLVKHEAFKGATRIDLDNWLYGEGVPTGGLPHVKSEGITHVDDALQALTGVNLLANADPIETHFNDFGTKQWSYFLHKAKSLPKGQVLALERHHEISKKNDEVRSNFYQLAIKSDLFNVYKTQISDYLGRVGRIKYAKPIYEALVDTNLKGQAVSLFEQHKHKHNHITNGAISRKLQQ